MKQGAAYTLRNLFAGLFSCLLLLISPSLASAGIGQQVESLTAVTFPSVGNIEGAGVWDGRPMLDPGTNGPTQEISSLLGAHRHRWPLRWEDIEWNPPQGSQHTYNWSRAIDVYNSDWSHGLRPLIVLTAAPWWAWTTNGCPYCAGEMPPSLSRLADWEAFVYQAARQFPYADFEIWNEPNGRDFWGCIHNGATGKCEGVEYPNASYYTKVLAAAHRAIESARADMKYLGLSYSIGIIGGALATVGSNEGNVPVETFARQMIQSGALQSMEAFSVHLYRKKSVIAPYDHTNLEKSYNDLKAALNNTPHSLPNPQIWVTEFGLSRNPPDARSNPIHSQTEWDQASVVGDTARWLASRPDVGGYFAGPIYLYGPSGSWDNGLSLTQPQGPYIGEPFGLLPYRVATELRKKIGTTPGAPPFGFSAHVEKYVENHIVVRTYCEQLCIIRHDAGWLKNTQGESFLIPDEQHPEWGYTPQDVNFFARSKEERSKSFTWIGPILDPSQIREYCISLDVFGPQGQSYHWQSAPPGGSC